MRSTVVLEKEKERTHQSSVNINNLQEKEYYMKKSRSLGSRCHPWTLSIHAYCTETPSHFMTIHPNRKKIYLQLIKSVVCEQNMKKKKSNTGFIKRSSSTNTSYFQYCSKMPISTQRHTVWNNKNANSFREVIRKKTLYNIILTKTATDLKTKQNKALHYLWRLSQIKPNCIWTGKQEGKCMAATDLFPIS